MRKNNSIIQVEEYKNKEHSNQEIEGKIDNLSKKVQKLLLEKEQGKLADQVELEKLIKNLTKTDQNWLKINHLLKRTSRYKTLELSMLKI